MGTVNDYRFLAAFRALFDGKIYRHRDSTQGDKVAIELFEDLYVRAAARDPDAKYVRQVEAAARVLNKTNKSFGIKARRGDGLFGEIMFGVAAKSVKGYYVKRGPTVATEIGAEAKIVSVAMLKQADRVIGDLIKQKDALATRTGTKPPISVAIVGVNHAERYCGYEGTRTTVTEGRAYRHPIQEAAEAKRRLIEIVKPLYDHFLLLEYSATNIDPFPFEWLNASAVEANYSAELSRMAREYEARF